MKRECFAVLPTSPLVLHYCFTNHSVIMAKQTSLFGKISGKLGAVVFSTSGGQTISREYNPSVSNPNTEAQVNQRARMKLMSQISASLASVIAMTKEGLVSKRNKFVKKNFASSYALDGVAQVTYENLQLTEGNLALPTIALVVDVYQGSRNLICSFTDAPSPNIARVVWCVFSKSAEGQLNLVASAIQTQREFTGGGSTFYFSQQFNGMPAGDLVVYAYGMVDTSERATAEYGNLNVVTGSDLARLVASRAIDYTDYQFTQTRGTTMGADNTPVQPTPAGSVRVYATALGNGGSVTGAGVYEVGASVTLTATANDGYQFARWIKNGTSETVSTSNPYTFNASEQVDLVAVFEVQGGGGGL